MITSIVVTGKHKIGMNSNKKIKIGDNILSVEKDIPFIRYRFDKYENEEYAYILDSMKQFSFSTHLIEIPLNENTKATLEYIEQNINSVAKYVYVDVTNEDVANGMISDYKAQYLESLAGMEIDRIMFKDKSSSLDTIFAKKLIKTFSTKLKLKEDNFGICSSPLSFSDWACLTAVKARELMSVYSPIADVALPSANHQCMNCCGCIRYMVVNEDTLAPADNKIKNTSKSDKNKVGTSKTKTNKASIAFGINSL